MDFYGHPFSSYCQKALIALYEKAIPFTFKPLSPEEPENLAAWADLWPIGKFPVLVDGDRTLFEASIIVEYLDRLHSGPVRLIPDDPREALDVRMLDRFFDNYISTPQQKIVFDALQPAEDKDAKGVADARLALEKAYDWLDGYLVGREWAVGDSFSLADCGAAPFLFYAHWTHPISTVHVHIHAYRKRLLARPSFARAVDEARPYPSFFPLGVPEDAD